MNISSNFDKNALKKIRYVFLLYLFSTLVPSIILFVASISNANFIHLGAGEIMLLITGNIAIGYYFIETRRKLNLITSGKKFKQNPFTSELAILYYVDFLIYMIAMLYGIFQMLIGAFLINGQAPKGMDTNPENAPRVLVTGAIILILSPLFMFYLNRTKKLINRNNN